MSSMRLLISVSEARRRPARPPRGSRYRGAAARRTGRPRRPIRAASAAAPGEGLDLRGDSRPARRQRRWPASDRAPARTSARWAPRTPAGPAGQLGGGRRRTAGGRPVGHGAPQVRGERGQDSQRWPAHRPVPPRCRRRRARRGTGMATIALSPPTAETTRFCRPASRPRRRAGAPRPAVWSQGSRRRVRGRGVRRRIGRCVGELVHSEQDPRSRRSARSPLDPPPRQIPLQPWTGARSGCGRLVRVACSASVLPAISWPARLSRNRPGAPAAACR